MFKVGDKVVCVDDTEQPDDGYKKVKKGIAYTVSFVGSNFDSVFIQLTELGWQENSEYRGFKANRFRKVDKKPFTNKLTAKLAKEALEEMTEYQPLEIETPLEA